MEINYFKSKKLDLGKLEKQFENFYHIVNMMLVALQLSKEAKYLVAGNPLSFNNHHLQETPQMQML